MQNRQRLLWAAVGASVTLALVVALSWFAYARFGRERLAIVQSTRDASTAETVAMPSPSFTAPPNPSATTSLTPSPTDTVAAAHVGALLPLVSSGSIPTPTSSPTVTATKTPKPTKTPRPTPTPTLAWPEALAEPGPSKLGLHVQWNNSPEIMEYVRRFKPPVIKAVGDFGFVAEAKKESPTTIIVGRLQGTDEGHAFRLEGDPVAAAQGFVAQRLETYQANPLVDYWEGLNEPGVNGKMAWYAAFESARVQAMAQHGLHCAIGAFSAGVPEWEEFEAFLPAIRTALAHDGILTLHEYDAPTLDRSAGAGLPGHPNYADRGALALRYRWWYEDFLKPRGLVIPLVISEAGVDGLIGNRPGPKGHGWLDFAGYWAKEGLGDDPIAVYLRQLAWYDGQLRQDDYVIGCAVFTAGAMGDDWKSYDITGILRHLAHDVVKRQ